jgi:hypothetical protein
MQRLKLTEIVDICKHGRAIQLFEPFLNHFCDIDYACILSEICINSALSVEHGVGEGWFRRTYEAWEILTGIPATRVRKVCLDLVSSGFIMIKVDRNTSHFQAIPDTISVIIGHVIPALTGHDSLGSCPLCGSAVIEGRNSYYCSAWVKGKKNVCCFCIWKDTLSRNGKDLVTTDEARRLLSGEEIDLPNLIGFKTKKHFSCKGVLSKRESGKYGIKFVFPPNVVLKMRSGMHYKTSNKEAANDQARRLGN